MADVPEDMTEKKGNKVPSKEEIFEALDERHTEEIRRKLWDSRVDIAGLGGLGSNVAVMLARSGIGHLHLVDFDVIDLTNINRQCYFIRHLGMPKTEAMTEIIHDINPYIDVQTDMVKITPDNYLDIFGSARILVEAFDSAANKAMLVNAAMEKSPETTVVSGVGLAGYLDSNLIKTRKISDNFILCGDGVNGLESGHRLMAPRVSICASHQANAVLQLLIEGGKNIR
ncbi:MAG: sulfur carrier protein ThiS adenylyltransferase ThiF [Anaerovoracaceae bacterium]